MSGWRKIEMSPSSSISYVYRCLGCKQSLFLKPIESGHVALYTCILLECPFLNVPNGLMYKYLIEWKYQNS